VARLVSGQADLEKIPRRRELRCLEGEREEEAVGKGKG
jgi:hypothetical protein